MIRGVARKYFEGKKCLFYDKYGLYRLADKRVKCKYCSRYYSLKKLKRDLQILYYFYLEISARKASKELKLNYKTIQNRFMKFRKNILRKTYSLQVYILIADSLAYLLFQPLKTILKKKALGMDILYASLVLF